MGLSEGGKLFAIVGGRKEMMILSISGKPIIRPFSNLKPPVVLKATNNPEEICAHII